MHYWWTTQKKGKIWPNTADTWESSIQCPICNMKMNVYGTGSCIREDSGAPEWVSILDGCVEWGTDVVECAWYQHSAPSHRRRSQWSDCWSLSSVSGLKHDLWCKSGKAASSLHAQLKRQPPVSFKHILILEAFLYTTPSKRVAIGAQDFWAGNYHNQCWLALPHRLTEIEVNWLRLWTWCKEDSFRNLYLR